MKKTREMDVELLRSLLRYEPEAGELFWLPRPVEMFPCARTCKTWNTRFAGKPALTYLDQQGYKNGCIFWVRKKAHRVIWAIVYGEWPDSIDHIDGDRANNRISNLRNVTNAENARNQTQHRRSTHFAMGVDTRNGGKTWRARKAGHYLGEFKTKEEALAAIKKAEQELGFHPNHGREIRRAA